jgi:hypothetical protein
MRWSAALAFVVLLSGCISAPEAEESIPTAATLRQAESEAPSAPFAAKIGLESANRAIRALRPDAVLVGVGGSADQSGASADWEYQYDSLEGKKGYAVEIPSGSVRERQFSFRSGVGESWVDSGKAASACGGEAGEYTLEVQDGKPAWTVITGDRTCVVDAVSGRLTGGGGE